MLFAFWFGFFIVFLVLFLSEALFKLTADVTNIYLRREVRPSLEVRSHEIETDSNKHILLLPAL